MKFQSTPFPRRATDKPVVIDIIRTVSIHALPAKGDIPAVVHPVEEREFQSTPFPRRAT